MPDLKKRQRFFDFMYEGCLTASMIHNAFEQLQKVSMKPFGVNGSFFMIGPYADYTNLSDLVAVDFETTMDPIDVVKKYGGGMGESADPSSL
jgi:hypothetical protein